MNKVIFFVTTIVFLGPKVLGAPVATPSLMPKPRVIPTPTPPKNVLKGALPQGRVTKTVAPKSLLSVAPKPTTPAPAAMTCKDYLASPIMGDVFVDSKRFYWIAKVDPAQIPAKMKDSDPSFSRFDLMSYEWSTKSLVRHVALKKKLIPHLLGHGNPVQGFTLLDLFDDVSDCSFGKGKAVSFRLDPRDGTAESAKNKVAASLDLGQYRIVTSDKGRTLFDDQRRRVVDIDPVSFQNRLGAAVVGRDDFLFNREGQLRFYTVKREGSASIFKYMRGSKSVVAFEKKLETNERLVLSSEGVLVASFSMKDNAFLLTPFDEAKDIMSTAAIAKFPNSTPLLPQEVAVYPQLKTKRGFLLGNSREAKMRAPAAWIFNFDGLTPATTLNAPDGQYVASGAWEERGVLVFFVLKDRANDYYRGIRIYDSEKKKWSQL